MKDNNEYIKTEVRSKNVNDDEVGVNESYEARIRGGLSPYWTLVELLSDDIFAGEADLIREIAKECKATHGPDILKLLASSEDDRRELTEMLQNNINNKN